MKLAIAHDSFTQMGGAERVVDAFHEIYPDAPVFCLVFDQAFKNKYSGWNIQTSLLQIVYNFYPHFQRLLTLIPWAVDSLDFTNFNVVLSSSSGFVKNIRVSKNSIHINYCHTPTRFLWSDAGYVNQEVPWIIRLPVKWFLKKMKKWDYKGAQRVTHFISNSKEVQKRIKQFYNRDSSVIYPFIDVNFWHPTLQKNNYFLIVGRLQAHKKYDLIVKIFNELGLPLHIVGTGRQLDYLRSIAKPNIKFMGRLSDEMLRDEYSGAKAIINPQIEDFGLVPLEAAACGTACIGVAKGGNLETVIPGITGELFGEDVVRPFMGNLAEADKSANYNVAEIKKLIISFNPDKYKSTQLLAHAQKFSKEQFKKNILNFVNKYTEQITDENYH